MADLSTEIAEYVRGERQAIEQGRLVAYIVADAAANPAWTKATYAEWDAAIDEAIKRGLLMRDGRMIRPAVKQVEPKAEQLELF